MDISELEKRAAELMQNLVALDGDGVARISPDLEPLQKDIADALRDLGDHEGLRDLAQAMDMVKETLSNPEFVHSLAESPAAAHEPQPEIFDAIEDCDVERVRAALEHWNVNDTFGMFDTTALYRAMSCMLGTSLEVIDLLLDAGADPKKGLTNTNVLHGLGFANLKGIEPEALVKRIRRCVEAGADIEERSDKLHWTPLITAVSEWNPVATEALLLGGADILARAGEVEGSCFSGADSMEFAEGHEATMAVLKKFKNPD